MKGEAAARTPKSGSRGVGPKAEFHPVDGLEILTYGPNNNISRVREKYDTAFGIWGQNGKWNAEKKTDRVLMKAPTGAITAKEIVDLELDTDALKANYRAHKMKNLPQQRHKILNTDRREQIQFILDHCEPDLRGLLKLSDVYKRETLVDNEEPDPIKIWDFCENLGIQLVEAEMTPADEKIYDEAVDHLQKGMNIRSGESIRAFQLCFDQQKEDCYRRKKSVVFSEAELAKRFWQAVSRCSRYAAAAKSMENLVTMQVPGVAVPKEVRLVVEWCENQDMVAAADAIVSGRKLSGASVGTDAVFVTTGGVEMSS